MRAAELASILAVLSGLVLLLASRANLGKVADFLSKPVLVGYMTGAALILMVSQLDAFLGIHLQNKDFFPRLIEAAGKLSQTHVPTVLLGVALLVLLLIFRRLAPRGPSALVACVCAIAASLAFRLPEHGGAVIGRVSGGLPHF